MSNYKQPGGLTQLTRPNSLLLVLKMLKCLFEDLVDDLVVPRVVGELFEHRGQRLTVQHIDAQL